jgi:hypothetical protein
VLSHRQLEVGAVKIAPTRLEEYPDFLSASASVAVDDGDSHTAGRVRFLRGGTRRQYQTTVYRHFCGARIDAD